MRWHVKLQNDLSRIHQFVTDYSDTIPSALTALELMTIALEDRRFFSHVGVDVRSVVRESLKVITFRKQGGASTIDMQFVRTATGYRAHTLRRKLYEAFLAMLIQFRYSKLQILRSYLACAFFGSGLTGAETAAQKMFRKNASQLGLEEASVVSAMLACPRPLNGSPHWDSRVRRRAAYAIEIYNSSKRRLSGSHPVAPLELPYSR